MGGAGGRAMKPGGGGAGADPGAYIPEGGAWAPIGGGGIPIGMPGNPGGRCCNQGGGGAAPSIPGLEATGRAEPSPPQGGGYAPPHGGGCWGAPCDPGSGMVSNPGAPEGTPGMLAAGDGAGMPAPPYDGICGGGGAPMP